MGIEEEPTIEGQIKKRMVLRANLLQSLYNWAEGSESKTVDWASKMKECQIPLKDGDDVLAYLSGEGWAEFQTRDHVRLTHAGIKQAERLFRNPGVGLS